MTIRETILTDLVVEEMSNTTEADLAAMGYNADKLTADGSTWIVYVYDCIRDYYMKNKDRLDILVDDILVANMSSQEG